MCTSLQPFLKNTFLLFFVFNHYAYALPFDVRTHVRISFIFCVVMLDGNWIWSKMLRLYEFFGQNSILYLSKLISSIFCKTVIKICALNASATSTMYVCCTLITQMKSFWQQNPFMNPETRLKNAKNAISRAFISFACTCIFTFLRAKSLSII